MHEATFVAGDKATPLSAHEKRELHSTLYKSLGSRPLVYLKATCRMYHAIFHSQHEQRSCCLVASDKSCLVYGQLKCFSP